MPDPAILSPLGQAMLAQLPPVLRDAPDYLAVIHAYAREVDLLDAAMDRLRSQFNPSSADILLPAWEYELHLPVGGQGQSIAVRRQNVLNRLRKILTGGQGREWEDTITAIVGPGWSYQEHDPADPTSPADGVVKITVPFPSGSPRFTEAQNQIRDITDAHIQIEFLSAAGFELDVSELDVTEFGN